MLAFTRRLLPLSRQLRSYSAAGAPNAAPALLDGEQNIHAKLMEKFAPSQLQVQDVSGAMQCLPVRHLL